MHPTEWISIRYLITAQGLKLVSLNVPQTADIFQPVTLSCAYDLEGRSLYSVKWYKDESEFFRYMPDNKPRSQAFHTPAVTLDMQNSDMNKVTLINLQFNTSGNFKCEVSAEAPNFETVAQNSNMTVMAFPAEDPMIEGVLSAYSIGDYVTANCTSGKSNPPAVLDWKINGVKAERWVWEYNKGADETDSQGLHTKTVGLRFQIQNEHFAMNVGGLPPRVEIRCTSTVGSATRYKDVFPTLARALTSNKLAQERFRNSAAGLFVTSSLKFIFVLIASIHTVYSS
ncbi:uncharacterized protein LOC110832180 isoform X4 [Zootermopsis nevadensis]|uniref:uncharacterized protein LOC110832180 isoform X4 n=1 Tax=Zootermopsis nevadensis TaxID=136037 RepID=UPI000B8E9C99|nr:uncharacterized protein LOC110832180 isoform X4 [Zootermopsis nevadensis]